MNVRDVGGALGISEEAAAKRITRAIDRLRRRLGCDLAPPVIGSLLAEMTRCAAPPGLTSSLAAAATTEAASGLVSQIVEGVWMMTKVAQLKLAGLIAGVAVLGGGVVATVATMASRQVPVAHAAFAGPSTQPAGRPSAEDIRRAKELQEQAWAFWRQQQFNDAAEKFQQSIDLVATDPDTWNGLGWTRFNSGDSDAGKLAFEKCVALDPTHAAGLNGLGQIALAKGQFDEAEKQLLKCADRAPAAAYGLSRLYLLQGKWTDAQKWLNGLVSAQQGAPDEVYARMLAAAKARKLDDDLRAMLAPPVSSEPAQQVMRAFALMQQGKMDEASRLFEDALAEAPEDPDVLNGVGWYRLNTGNITEAQSMFELALQHSPSHPAAMNGLAQCYRMAGKVDEAIALWEQMMKSAPQANAAMYSLAQVYLERGEFEKALPLWEKLARHMPENEQVQASLAAAREGAKK
jgi:pentatricopeptide repeat protein